MKKSLELLGVTSSGLEASIEKKKNDENLVNEAALISDLDEREKFLLSFLEKKTHGYVKSKCLLADLIKSKNPAYACDLVMSACQAEPVNPKNYLLFAEIAFEHKAWDIVLFSLDIVKWLSDDKSVLVLNHAEELRQKTAELINQSNLENNSNNAFWKNKKPEKFWILERLYYQSKLKGLIRFSFKLLNTFPYEIQNYHVVYSAFTLLDDKTAILDLYKHINKILSDDNINKNLYLGMIHYHLSEYDKAVQVLNEVLAIKNTHPNALLFISLSYLIMGNAEKFSESFNKIIPGYEPQFIALYFIYSAFMGASLDKAQFPNQKMISREIIEVIKKLIYSKRETTAELLIQRFQELGYFAVLPFLQLYIAELLIKNNELDKAEKMLSGCIDEEVHRIKAWIYRIRGLEDSAEKELILYRQKYLPDKDMGFHCKLVNLDLNYQISENTNENFKLLRIAFEQTKKLISIFDMEYGLNSMTCVETGCQDCCTKTFPYVSFIEYSYMNDWLSGQSDEIKNKIYKVSRDIVNLYKNRYGKEPPFMHGESFDLNKEFPTDFVFECPFLGDNKCNIYENRPFTCRAYSYGSQDGVRYKGCNYFFEQFKGANKLTDVRKVINMASFFDFAKKIDEKLIGKRIIAPIPVWFAQSYEETLEKINRLL
ncbi:MAG: hypothetical protein A3B68_03925 [Candidatus Melainabacteria bacterium RIFCSPHIGHO2_02_FULL_34_12]|nr:MAG: hypothetical protein A3B68_03925 [Candidatus Melainabacteria bacterium RIFCSPHIGHO2_02_FULL_34_12]